jgi:hypothetical protein
MEGSDLSNKSLQPSSSSEAATVILPTLRQPHGSTLCCQLYLRIELTLKL